MERKSIEVVAAILICDGRLFATRRGYGEWRGWWEFHGGKIEPGESHQEALKREMYEELATDMEVKDLLVTVEYDYPKFHLRMHCYLCSVLSGGLTLLEHDDSRWLSKENLYSVDWLPADKAVLAAIEEIL